MLITSGSHGGSGRRPVLPSVRGLEQATESLTEQVPCSMQSSPNATHGRVHDERCFRVRQPVQITQDDHFAIAPRQPPQRAMNLCRSLGAFEQVERVVGRTAPLQADGFEYTTPPGSSPLIATQIAGDAVEIGREPRAGRIIAWELRDERHEHLLRDILGGIRTPRHCPSKPIDDLVVSAIHQLEGLSIPSGGASKQVVISLLRTARLFSHSRVIGLRGEFVPQKVATDRARPPRQASPYVS
jgi:hypothetical protein